MPSRSHAPVAEHAGPTRRSGALPRRPVPGECRLLELAAVANTPPMRRVAAAIDRRRASTLRPPNRTGLPDALKAGVEALSGLSLDDVRVHRNSDRPARVGALAYAQGTDIHLAAGQAHHLAHEAWHVVQQKRGLVRPTARLGGHPINTDPALERDADRNAARALAHAGPALRTDAAVRPVTPSGPAVAQLMHLKHGALVNGSGSWMEAEIYGAGDPDLGKGSKPKVEPHWYPAAGTPTGDFFQSYIVQGHLLNMELGGSGKVMENLTPITRSTNSTHFKKVEDGVKKQILANNIVKYRVEADYSTTADPNDMGAGALAKNAAFKKACGQMAGQLTCWYDVWDSVNGVWKASDKYEIKNEEKSLTGTF